MQTPKLCFVWALNWQKLLIVKVIKKSKLNIKNICFLDIDILINYHLSPNIFDFHVESKISLVSERHIKGLDLHHTLKQISFNRNFFIQKNILWSLLYLCLLKKYLNFINSK